MNIEAKNLSKIYGDGENRVVALDRANLEIVSSDFISIMGPSGSGKSTLLHLLSGLDKPSSGSLTYDGKDIYSYSDKELSAFRRKRIGFIFQQFNLLPVLTAKENIIMPLLLDKQKPNEAYLKDCKWSATTIIRILQDETYTGTLVQGKQTTPHFKLKEREDKPSSEWIRVEGTHEAIIQKHDFDLVQRLRRIDTRTSPKSDKVYLFSGILICGCCGCRMTRKTNRYKDKEYHYYYCPTGKKNGCTSSVMLKESDLIECVQDSLKGHIENVASLDALLSSISQERINRELAQEYAAQIRVNEKRVAQTEGFKAKLYENLVSGILTKEEFLSYKRKYNADIELFQKARP